MGPADPYAHAGGILDRVKAHGGEVLFGPAREEDEGFDYGAFADVEGNQVWVVSLPASPA